jgi:hypothetical protein
LSKPHGAGRGRQKRARKRNQQAATQDRRWKAIASFLLAGTSGEASRLSGPTIHDFGEPDIDANQSPLEMVL